MKKGKIVIIAVVVAALAISAVTVSMYIDSRPWLFGGIGMPDVIYLNGSHKLEKVMAFDRDHRVVDIKNDTVIYTDKDNGVFGAVGFSGEIAAFADTHETGVGFMLDENGDVYEIDEQRSAEQNADKPVRVIDAKTVLYYDSDGLKAVRINDTLGVFYEESDEPVTLFRGNDGRESPWRLEDPLFFGEYVRVRIYWCDCIYKIVHESE